MTQSMEKISLYDKDFLLWIEDTVAKLRSLQRYGVILLQHCGAISYFLGYESYIVVRNSHVWA